MNDSFNKLSTAGPIFKWRILGVGGQAATGTKKRSRFDLAIEMQLRSLNFTENTWLGE